MNNPNPVVFQFNQQIDFQLITSDHIREATEKIQEEAQQYLAAIYQPQSLVYDQTLALYDRLQYRLGGVYGVIYLLAHTSAQDEIRYEAHEAVQKLEQFLNALQLDETLYQSLKKYAQSPDAQQLTGVKAKFLKETIEEFERNGFALPAEKREQLKNWQDELSQLTNEFQKNIAEYQDFILLTEAEMAGLPDYYRQQHRAEDGQYKITLDYPSFYPFMQMADSEEARKALYFKYLNKAANKNLTILEQVLRLRQQIAELLGFATFAQYRLAGRMMAKHPEAVWVFEQDLAEKVRLLARRDYEQLLAIKKQQKVEALELNAWESSYYQRILLKEQYSVDTEKVKEYFELNQVIAGLFAICEKLFGIRIGEKTAAKGWHEEVRLFEVIEKEKIIGHFYLDLFPRPNKYGHAACFPILMGCQTPEGYQQPLLALVCNFPRPTPEKPSLLAHSEVETLFHEFGHALHCLLTTSPLASYAGTNTARDFVEVPSQLFENWAWDYESLCFFARHYQTQDVMPPELFGKMRAARQVGLGLHTLQQIFYGSYDLYLHDQYKPNDQENTTTVLQRLQSEITLFPYQPNTYFQAGFGHLMGYEASYYGYLWSLVFAEDIFAVFEQNGILNAELGQKYRNTILSRGGSEDEEQQMVNFLGRKPNPEAFLVALGLSQS